MSPRDRAAVDALRAANGVCERCEERSPAMLAVERPDGGVAAVCFYEANCNARIRRQMRAASERGAMD